MNRTHEFRKLLCSAAASPISSLPSSIQPPSKPLILAKETKLALSSHLKEIDTATSAEYFKLEKQIKDLLDRAAQVQKLLAAHHEATQDVFTTGVIVSIRKAIAHAQVKLQTKEHKKRRATLNIALEPEKANASIRSPQPLFQLLHEENEKILKSVQYTDKELLAIRRKISEIDTLQQLISQEIFSQDERIDQVLNKTTNSSIDIKISRTYIRSAEQKRKTAQKFISMLIFIFSLMILLLHLSKSKSRTKRSKKHHTTRHSYEYHTDL